MSKNVALAQRRAHTATQHVSRWITAARAGAPSCRAESCQALCVTHLEFIGRRSLLLTAVVIPVHFVSTWADRARSDRPARGSQPCGAPVALRSAGFRSDPVQSKRARAARDTRAAAICSFASRPRSKRPTREDRARQTARALGSARLAIARAWYAAARSQHRLGSFIPRRAVRPRPDELAVPRDAIRHGRGVIAFTRVPVRATREHREFALPSGGDLQNAIAARFAPTWARPIGGNERRE